MNKAALKRLIDAIDHDDLHGVQRALEQGAGPTDHVEGWPIPAFYLTTRKAPLRQAVAMLDLFLQHGLDPNQRFTGSFGRPLRIPLGTPLLLSMLNGAPSAEPGEPLVQRLLDAGANPLLETTGGPFHNAWHRAAGRQRLEALDLLDRATPSDWTVPDDRVHPVELAFDMQRFQDQEEDRSVAVANRVLQRFPHALDHRYDGATVIMRLQRAGRGCLRGVVWALEHGASTTDVWEQGRSSRIDPEEHPVLPAGRPFSIWPTLVRLARSHGTTHPLVQRAWHDPDLMAALNQLVWHRDVQEYGSDDRQSTPLSLALHEDVHPMTPGERTRWEDLIDAMVAQGAVPNHLVDPSCPTPGQAWLAANDTGHSTVLDRYPAWEAPHPVSGRTPLFEATTPEAVEVALQRGQRLDHVDAAGEQAFATLVARGILEERSALIGWCVRRLEQQQAPLNGLAQGRTLQDWAGSRADLLKALERATNQRPGVSTAAAWTLALHAAADGKRLEVMRRLLAKGVDVNVQDAQGLTPAMRVLMAPVTTLKQVIKRSDMLALLAQHGARGDAVGTATFDLRPERAKHSSLGHEPGLVVTSSGSALHIAGLLAIDGEESLSAKQRFALVRTLLAMPGATDPAAWSGRCSDLVAQVLLSAQQPHEQDAGNRPPTLTGMWETLGLDRLNPALREDLFMALMDPRRALSQEGRNTGFMQELVRRCTRFPSLIDERVQWLVDRGAHPFAVDLEGRRLIDAMHEWSLGTHPPTRRLTTFGDTDAPVRVSPLFQASMVARWKRWVDVAVEAQSLQEVWTAASVEATPRERRRL